MTADERHRIPDGAPGSYRRLTWFVAFAVLLASRCLGQDIPQLRVPDTVIVSESPPAGVPIGTSGEYFSGNGLPRGLNHPIGIDSARSSVPVVGHYVARQPSDFSYQGPPVYEVPRALAPGRSVVSPGSPIPEGLSLAASFDTPPLHLVLHERFLNRFIEQSRFETGEVRDYIEGARVYGVQGTQSQIRIDVAPHPTSLAFRILLQGNVQSQTNGYTPMAVVQTLSEQRFLAGKLIHFDGSQILTQHPQFLVSAQNHPVGAATPLSRSWLLGPISEQVALRVAESKRPNTEAIARQRVVEQAGPRLNSEIDQILAQGNQFLQTSDFWGKIKNNRWLQGVYRSTETHAHIALRPKAGVSWETVRPPQRWAPEDRGATLFLHESLLAQGVELANLSGRTVTDRQLRKILEEMLAKQFELDYPPAPPSIPEALRNVETEIEFAENDPLSIRFDGDRIHIRVQCTLRPGGQKLIPPLSMEWDYFVVDRGAEWEFQPRNVRVELKDNSSMEAMMKSLATSAVTAQLPTFIGSKLLDVSRFAPTINSNPPMTLRVGRLQLVDGWLILALD